MTSLAPARLAYERSTHARTLGEMFLRTTAEHHGVALRYREEGEQLVEIGYAQLGALAREIARGLVALGVEPGDRVSILSDTRAEWTYADAGAMCAGAVVAPIYHTNSPGECRYVLEHSGAKAVFCEDQAQLEKIAAIRDELPELRHVIALDGSIEGSISVDDLREAGAAVSDSEIEERVAAIDENHVATYIYTSGTTGPPKACMLTHRNWLSTMRMYEERLELEDGSTVFMFLPLAHALARVTQMVVLDVGGTLAFWRRDPLKLLDDIKESNPTHFPSVPRVFEKIHTAAAAGIVEQSAVKRALVRWALATGRRGRRLGDAGRRPSPLFRAGHALADRLVLSKVRGLFGDQLAMALVGAAPIARESLEFFDACGILILEGYGLTETCAAATLNTNREYRFGTVGRPLGGEEVAIAADGEVLVRGPNVFAGYYKNEPATREALDDGWLRTGDLGSIADGYLSITGRKKDIIITSSGKNITPVNLENELKATRWISEAVVYGDNRSYLVALITLDPDELPKLAEHLGVQADPSSMAKDPAVRAEIQSVVDSVNERFARIEQVKRFAILDRQLTQEGGELTPTMKMKRPVVYERYQALFDSLYGN
jgi:long-chain acyl-CoA synthetase